MEQTLSDLQRWMQSLLLNPDGSDASAVPEIATVILPSTKLSSKARLQVYCNAYFARLLDCLRDEFSVLNQFLGPDLFDGLAAHYLGEYPSQSDTLADLGARFPAYLQESRQQFGDLDVPGADGSPPWTQFLIDLALLERIQSEVFDGPGVEGVRLLSAGDLQGIPVQNWPQIQIQLVPCLRLLKLEFPIHDYLASVRNDPDAPLPAARPTWLAVTRRNFRIHRIPLEHDEFQILVRLLNGMPLGAALQGPALQHADFEAFLKRIPAWFQAWSGQGFFLPIADELSRPR